MLLDWFTAHPFEVNQLAAKLGALPEKPTEVKQQGAHRLRAYYGSLKTSFLRYTQVVPQSEVLTVAGMKIPVADVETLAVMKAAAVHDRGTKRDLVAYSDLIRPAFRRIRLPVPLSKRVHG